jgi:hypothetical protein
MRTELKRVNENGKESKLQKKKGLNVTQLLSSKESTYQA